MADFYVDEKGSITVNRNRVKSTKKKKKTDLIVNSKGSVSFNPDDDIAPIKSSKKNEKRTWFSSGAFDDGYDFGDITKSILGTATDVYQDAVKGVSKMGEGVIDTGAYLVGGAAKLMGNDKFADKTSKFISRDLTDELGNSEVATNFSTLGFANNLLNGNLGVYKSSEYKNTLSNYFETVSGDKNVEKSKLQSNGMIDKNSLLGDKSDSLVQSGGQLLGTIGLQAVGVPWFATTGVSSFGRETEQAFNNDATYGEAGFSGLVSAGAEILTEKISGGISFGGKTLDAGLKNELTKGITNKTINTLTQFGIDVVGEGGEEVLSEVISNIGKKLSYEDEKTWSELLTSEEAIDSYIESFIGGAVLGGGFNVGKAASSIKTGRNYDTGLTTNEQKVVDKEVENRIAEAEQNGTKPNKKKIHEEVIRDLEKGYISLDSIESTLGGETYNQYKSLTDKKKSLESEINTLENKKLTEFTVKDNEKLQDLRNQLSEIDTDSIKSQLTTEVDNLTQSDYFLRNSYNENTNKGVNFNADLTEYDAKQQKIVQKAIDSGILNNTNKTHDFVDMIAKISADKGVDFDFTNNENLKSSGFAIEGKTVNGFVKDGSITLNIDSNKALNKIVGHEITHVLEGTDLYTELQQVVKEYATTKGEYDARLNELTDLYKNVDNANIENELTADLIGDYLFTDPDFVNNLSVEKPNVFKKIFEEIKHLYKLATAGSKEARQLEKVKKAFEDAYKQNNVQSSENIEYSVAGKKAMDNIIENDSNNSSLKDLYDLTIEMYNNGATREEIAQANHNTWYVDRNGDLKFEFSDKDMALKDFKKLETNHKYTLEEILEHDKLFIAYPELREFNVKFSDMDSGSGYYNYFTKTFVLNNKLLNTNEIRLNETLIHEIQHGIQRIEGFEKGTGTALGRLRYYDNLGEIDATDVANRYKTEANGGNVKDIPLQSATVNPEHPNLQKYLNSGDIDKVRDSIYTFFKERSEKSNEKVVIKNNSENLHSVRRSGLERGEFKPKELDDSSFFDTKYSLTDNQGRELTKEQQEFFKDSKERDIDGSLKEMYHGTKNYGFTVFDRKYAKSSGNFGTGIYFAPTQDYSNAYGEMYKVYLNIKNPVDAINKQRTLTDEQVNKLVEAVANNEDYGIENYGYNATVESVTNDLIQHNNDFEIFQDLDITCVGDFAKLVELSNEVLGTDFDGIRTPLESIVFNSNQIKNVDNTNPTDDPDIRHSLSNQDEQIAPSKGDIYGSDIKLQVEEVIAPLKEDIAKLQESLQPVVQQVETNLPTEDDSNTDSEYAPLTEEDLPYVERQYEEDFRNIDESYAPIETEQYYDVDEEISNVAAESPLEAEGRDIDTIGKQRKVNAYQYDNPEVMPYFQEEAGNMLWELDFSTKGERFIIGDTSQVGDGNYTYSGTKRNTSPDIAYLLDEVGMSYDDIEKGLRAIIEDHGAENIAASKKIEFVIDERLRKGYKTFGEMSALTPYVEPNQSYIKLLENKKAEEYYNSIPIDESLIPAEDTIENIAPIKESKFNDSGQGVLDLGIVRKLKGPEGEAKNKDVEPIDLEKTKQLTIDGTEEDLVTKTKRELRQALMGNEHQKDFIRDALDNAKNRSMALMNNTDTIRNTELVFGRDNASVINDLIFQKEIDNEADSIAWQNKERQEIKDLGIKARSKESAAVQKYGEKQYVNEYGELIPYTDKDLAIEFPNIETQNKIKNAARVIRRKYDSYIDEANNVLTKLGFDPIPKRNDYMRHFQELNDVFSRYGIPFNAQNMQEHVLPTDINGLTENWSPQKNYFANIQPRKGVKTTYDAITGVDGYIGGISNLIFHTEDIQRGRAFEELIRETYGEDKGFENLENLPDELKQARMEKIQDNHLSNYAAWVHEWTNNVAGKKNKIDRSVEAMFGRKAFTILDEVRKQVGSNMIGLNLSSSLTNLIAPVQAIAKTNKLAVAKGTADTIKNMFIKDNFMEKNKFLTSRMGTDMLSKNAWQKIQDAGFIFMKGMDWFSSNQIVRSKYYELRSKGMNEADAHAEAGKFAARILGDRTKGANAQLYNSKLIGLVTQFQLEVNNQLYSQFYDTYHESKENAQGNALKTAAGMTFTLGQIFAFTHLFGQTFESIAGYNPTMDIVEMIKTAFGWGDDEEEEKPLSERLKKAADMLVDSLPYVNILTGGGRIPVASGIPNLVGVATGGKDEYGNELTLEDELKKLLYLIPPTGGNQFKKTTQGLGMFDEDLPVSGSYTDSGNLRFPVEDTPLNRVQAAIFGQYANENAGNYFDNKRQPLKEKQIQEYADLDIPIADYWKYREGLKEQNTVQEKFDYIESLDVSDEQKNIMINNAISREDQIDMSNYDNFGSYEEFDYATKNPDKYEVITKIDTFDKYNTYKDDIASIKEQFSNDNGYSTKERKAAVRQYIESLSLDVPQKIMLEKMAGGYSIKDYENYMFQYIESLEMTAEEKQKIHNQLFD